jgi:putative DNA primase/helicase
MSARPEDLFAVHMQAHGLTPPAVIVADGQIRRFSTNGKRSDTAGGYVLHAGDPAAGAFWCWRSGLFQSWCSRERSQMTEAEREALERKMARGREQAQRERAVARGRNQQRIDSMWSQSRPVTPGDPVHKYLRNRGLEMSRIPAVLRLHPALDYWQFDDDGRATSLGRFPAMVAAVQADHWPWGLQGPNELRTVALHRTYLTHDGRKADVPTPKKLTGASAELRGAAIRLAEPHVIDNELSVGVAEGIETALAACEGTGGIPCWSAVSASGIASFRWPEGTRYLYVFSDHDANGTGQRAARELSRKAISRGLIVRTLTPPEPGTDWMDVWAKREMNT